MNLPRLIVFSGLPGSGKSTLAEAVAKELKLPVFSVDPIESAIIKSGIAKSFETGLAAYLVAETLAAEQLKLGNSVIIDAVNAEEEAKNVWRNLAGRTKVKLIIIECTTSDPKLHRSRIATRVRNMRGMPEVTWDKVEARRKVYTEWTEPVLEIDTSKEITTNVREIIKYMEKK